MIMKELFNFTSTITRTDSFATSTATQPGLITYQITTKP